MTKRLTIFFALLVAVGGVLDPGASKAQTKHVLLEEYTGTWCGWCVQGLWAIHNLDSAYGDKFIPVAFHNGDPMAISTGTDTLEHLISGYPTGWIDRVSYDNQTWSAGGDNSGETRAWNNDVMSELAAPVVADVNLSSVSFDPITRLVTANMDVNFFQAASGDIRLNIYVVEDSLSGPAGTSWDQHNYLNSTAYPTLAAASAGVDTNKPWGRSPYHSLPGAITGMVFNHVVREVVGGAFGVAGVIPASVSAGGKYSKTFTFTLPPYVRADHATLVGFAFNYSASDITANTVLNAASAKLSSLPPVPASISAALSITATKPYITATAGTTTTDVLTLKNTSSSPITAGIAVDNTSARAGWSVALSSNTVTVPANGTATATATFTAPAGAGYYYAVFGTWPQIAGESSVGTEVAVGALSSATKIVGYGSDPNLERGLPAKYAANYAAIPFNSATVAAYPAANFDAGIFTNVPYFDLVATANGPIPAIVPIANQLLGANKKVFITSEQGLRSCFDKSVSNYAYCNTPAVTAFFNTKLGIKYVAQTTRNNGQTLTPYNIAGTPGDPIGDGLLVQAVSNGTGLTDLFSIKTQTKTTQIFNADDDPTVPAGIKFQDGTAKLVYLDFLLSGLQDASISDQIVSKSMDWLFSTAAVSAPAEIATGITVSQNPFSTSTNVNYVASNNESGVQMSVVDLLGRTVASLTPVKSGLGYAATINGSDLATGAYHVVVRSSAGLKQIPVMITR